MVGCNDVTELDRAEHVAFCIAPLDPTASSSAPSKIDFFPDTATPVQPMIVVLSSTPACTAILSVFLCDRMGLASRPRDHKGRVAVRPQCHGSVGG